jgi:hypothetical protein
MELAVPIDVAEYLVRYPKEITFGDADPEEVFDRYHTPDFEMRNDGLPLDRERLLAHVRPARKNAVGLEIEVHQVVVEGDQVAARYTMTARMRRGGTIVTEIYAFGRIAPDGRLRSLDQITRTIPT